MARRGLPRRRVAVRRRVRGAGSTAHDEVMSTAGWEDIPFYRSLGPASFGQLLRELKNDEATHYRNAVNSASLTAWLRRSPT